MERAQKFVVVQAGTHAGATLGEAMNLVVGREAARGLRVEQFQVGGAPGPGTAATLLFGPAVEASMPWHVTEALRVIAAGEPGILTPTQAEVLLAALEGT